MARVASDFNQESLLPVEFGFLLAPKFSMLALAGVLEPLRMAGQCIHPEVCESRASQIGLSERCMS
ncbi:MAG TPA: hypothetical protein VFR20_07760 [Burkholderiaceae bacterium]|nr:hypothetical protein [Burkholderiaceae bacterium]